MTQTTAPLRSADARANTSTGAEAMVRLLAGHGVRHIFGLCGDTSLPFYDALARLDHGIIEHILTRDERHAAYMADAYARVTGRPGICEGPSGGGATYILPGLVEANESSVPVFGDHHRRGDDVGRPLSTHRTRSGSALSAADPMERIDSISRGAAADGPPCFPRDDCQSGGRCTPWPALRRTKSTGPGK